MPGERDLNTLLRKMKPDMQDGIFVFCSIGKDRNIPSIIEPLLTFQEPAGFVFQLFLSTDSCYL